MLQPNMFTVSSPSNHLAMSLKMRHFPLETPQPWSSKSMTALAVHCFFSSRQSTRNNLSKSEVSNTSTNNFPHFTTISNSVLDALNAWSAFRNSVDSAIDRFRNLKFSSDSNFSTESKQTSKICDANSSWIADSEKLVGRFRICFQDHG